MKRKISVLTLTVVLLLAACMVLSSCSQMMALFDKNRDDLEFVAAEYENYDPGFTYLNTTELDPAEDEDEIPEEVRDIDLELDEDYIVSYEKVQASSSYEDICAMGANDDLLYPGALVDTKNDAYKPIYIDRAPITISANLESVLNTSATLSSVIEDPNLSSVRTGIREIVSQNITGDGGQLPSNIYVEIREINSQDEFFMNLGFGLQYRKFNLSENFTYDKMNKQTNLAIILKQVYYTVDVDYEGVDGFFSDKLSNESIEKKLEGTVPAYVSSVSYGRIAIITIQSNFTKEEITNALSASWGNSSNAVDNALSGLSASFDSTLKSIASDSDTEINYYVYGGGSGTGNNSIAITADSSEMISQIFASFNAADSVGLPISYRLRLLNGELHKIQETSEYVVKNVTYIPSKVRDWTYLDKILQDKSIKTMEELKIDLSSLVNFFDLESTNDDAQRTLVVPKNIKDLYLIGPNDLTDEICFRNLSIKVADRTEPLTIHLSNISFSANTDSESAGGIAIISDQYALLTLDIEGDVSVMGANGAAISAKNLTISGDGTLNVYGGTDHSAIVCEEILTIETVNPIYIHGGTGHNGQTAGENGADGAIGIVARQIVINTEGRVNIYGGNGGTGGDGYVGETGKTVVSILTGKDGNENYGKAGGHGGNGGNGGLPYTGEIVFAIENTGNLLVRYGNGGNGGAGGTGGTGGNYYNSVGSVWRCGGGSGGNGGQGGNGNIAGKGGAGGSIGESGSNNSVNGIGLGINYGSVFYDNDNHPVAGQPGADGTTWEYVMP